MALTDEEIEVIKDARTQSAKRLPNERRLPVMLAKCQIVAQKL